MKITISIQDELHVKLNQFVPPRGISDFISKLIEKELDNREAALLKAYQEAYADPERNQLIDEWDALNSDIIDGSNNTDQEKKL